MPANDQVAHIWAAYNTGTTDKSRARSSNGNFSFADAVLYSYATDIARFVKDDTGRTLYVLCDDHAYSMTTIGKHYNARRRALHGLALPMVYHEGLADTCGARLLEHSLERAAKCEDKAKRSRKYADQLMDSAAYWYAQAETVASAHGLPLGTLTEHHARMHRERETRETCANFSRFWKDYHGAAGGMFEAPLKALAEVSAGVEWLSAIAPNVRLYHGDRIPTLLRVNGDKVETSRGAEFPLADGLRALPFIAWSKRPGGCEHIQSVAAALANPPRLGHFRVDRVEPDGTVVAGCHRVPEFAVRWAARQAGYIEAPELDHVAAHVANALNLS